MPWPEVSVMESRLQFVLRALRGELPFVVLCAEYGISPKTGYKWQERFLREGAAGLSDRSRRPRASPTKAGDELVCALVRLKLAHSSWGPKKLRELLIRQRPEFHTPALSTVKRILDQAGLVRHRRRRPAAQGGRLTQDIRASAPNQVWTVDFKGWWYSSARERIEPLTVRDEFSRYILCARALPDSRSETVQECFAQLFSSYGLPQVIHSDNGVPFACAAAPLGLSRLAAWWVALGIGLSRITPAGRRKMARMNECIATSPASWKAVRVAT